MTNARKAELFDKAIEWIWDHSEGYDVQEYLRALKHIGYTQEEILEEIANNNFDDEDLGDDEYIPSSTNGDYSPSNPWDAPGMSIKDFI
jgi:hypothetical protein